MQLDYTSEKHHPFTEINNIKFRRKLVHETAFDGIVKIFVIESSLAELNVLLRGRFFGAFFHSSPSGIFLRMFNSKDSWPNSTLVFVDLQNVKIEKIKKTSSSWDVWTVDNLEGGKYSINISPYQRIEFHEQ